MSQPDTESLDLDLDLDELVAESEDRDSQKERSAEPRRGGLSSGQQPLYFDLETVPDEERMHLFDLPEIPQIREERDPADCPPVEDLLKKPLDQLEADLIHLNPRHDYLNRLTELEGKKDKPRGGVKGAIAAVFKARSAAISAADEQRKKLSVTPEFCRIVAMGWAVGNAEPTSIMVDPDNRQNEPALLELFWRMAALHSPIIGFNCIGFDLQVIKARSVILGVEPSKVINDSPYGNREVCDLMLSRFGRGAGNGAMGLKKLAKLYGIPVPAGEVTGSDVEILWRTDREKLGEYVRSDVWITRELRRKWSGYFCV